MRTQSLQRFTEIAVLSLLAFTILWKGGKTLESSWLLFGVAALCFAALLLRRGFRTDHPALTLLIFLQIVWICLSFIFSTTQNYGFDEVLRSAGLGILLLWIIERPIAKEEQKNPFEERFFRCLVKSTLLACGIGFFVYTLQPVNRFVATFLDPRFHTDYWPNAAAQFLLLAWPLALLQDLGHRTWDLGSARPRFLSFVLSPKSLSRLSLGLILGSLFLTYSRGAFLAFLGQLALLSLFLLLRRKNVPVTARPLALIVGALLLAGAVFSAGNALRSRFHPVQSLEEKLTFTATEGTSSISERAAFFGHAWQLSIRHPLRGWGPYSFRFVQPRLQESVLATSDHPHNVFLKLSSEQGFFAALLFGVLIGIALLTGVRLTFLGKRTSSSDHSRLGALLMTIALTGVLAHNLIDYNLQFVGIALPFWMIMGILLRKMENGEWRMENKNGSKTKFSILNSQFSILCIVVLLLLFLSIREGYFLVTSSLGRHAEARGNTEKALLWYGRSKGALFTRDLELSRAHLLRSQGTWEEAEAAVRAYLVRNAEDARAWNFLGSILLETERFPEAIVALKQAFALGSMNDLSISRHLLEALLADTYSQPTSAGAAESTKLLPHPELAIYAAKIETLVLAFADAIQKNLHFTALSPNPEEAAKILVMLTILSPEKSQQWKALSAVITQETQEERNRIRARPPGFLW